MGDSKTVTIQGTSYVPTKVVEELVCKSIEKLNPVKLTQDQIETLTELLAYKMLNMTEQSSMTNMIKKLESDPQAKMIKNRLASYGIKITHELHVLMYMTPMFSTPGVISLMSAYLAYHAKKLDTDTLDVIHWCTNIFPNGYYSHDDLKIIWDKQKFRDPKYTMDNCVDIMEFNSSLIRKEDGTYDE